MNWSAELAFAHELADLADAITLPAFRARPEAHLKDDGSPVTQADLDTERVLREAISARYPDHAVLGEENGLEGPADAPTWIVDPIDGTKNFVRGVPVYATLVALAVEERGVLGLVSAPALGTRWDGVVGGPARQDGETIHVSQVDDLAEAHVSFGGFQHFLGGPGAGLLERAARATARQRGFGDFWQHCLVASGGVDVAMEGEVNRWDLAAVKVLVEAAGGRFTSLAGEDTDAGGSAVSTNGRLHEAVLSTLLRSA